MSHKKHLKHLKKHDPITYSELMGNPTGAESDGFDGCLRTFVYMALFSAICTIAMLVFILNN